MHFEMFLCSNKNKVVYVCGSVLMGSPKAQKHYQVHTVM